MLATLSSTASGTWLQAGTSPSLLPVHPVVPPPQPDSTPQSNFAPDTIAENQGLAHDAGNLLGALGLYCELLALPGVLQQEHRHYADELRLLSGRSRALIERLLRVETTSHRASKPEPAFETVLLPEVIDHCRGVLEAIARRALTVVYEADAAQPVRVPRESIERILVNLTRNATEALPDDAGSAITLRVSCRRAGSGGGWVVLSVEDNGRGMSTAAVRSLLRQTARAPRPDGHGIGFQIVRELVGASGGRLRLSSRIGDGTTVSIAWAIAVARNEQAIQPAWDSACQAEGRLSC